MLLFFAASTWATNYISVNNGAWNNPATWSPAGIPNISNTAAWPGDNVTISHNVTYTGNLITAQQASVLIKSTGSLSVSGLLNIANTSVSTFTLQLGGSLSAQTLRVSSCCATVALAGSIAVDYFDFTASKDLTITGTLNVSNDFNTQGGNSITFDGATLNVLGRTTSIGGVKIYVDGNALLNFGDLRLQGNADILGINQGGVINFVRVTLQNPSTIINCVNNMCQYSGASNAGNPPNPLDLKTGAQFLPVSLLFFDAQLKQEHAALNWATDSESANDYFLVEHSTDGRTFTTLATVKGQGNSSTRTDYQWLHSQPASGNNYYRLWQFDWDGTATMLGLRQVNAQFSSFTIAGVSPNPSMAGQTVKLHLATGTYPMQVILLASSGQSWPLPFTEGADEVRLPDHLPAGLYYLQVTSANGRVNVPLVIAKK